MRFNFAKMITIAGLVVGASAVFAQSSILDGLKNADASSNTAMSVESMNKKGGDADSNGDKHSNDHTGNKGKGGGGEDKGGHNPPSCVPEPCSMLAMGLGAGFMALKRRRAAK